MKQKTKNVFSVFKVHYYWLNLFGYAPFTLVTLGARIEICTQIKDICFWLISCLANLISLYGFYELELWRKLDSSLLSFCLFVTTHVSYSANLYVLVVHFLKRKKLAKLLFTIHGLDKEVEDLQIAFNHSKQSIISALYLVITVSLEFLLNALLVYLWICYFDITFSVMKVSSMLWVITSNFCLQNFNYLLMWTIKLRLKAINRRLWSTFLDPAKPTEKIVDVRKLASAVDLFNDLIEMFNDAFSSQLMACFIAFAINSVCMLFDIYSGYSRTNPYETGKNIFSVLWFCIFLMVQLCTIYVSSTTAKEGKVTAKIVHKILLEIHDTELQKELLQFSQQLLHRTPFYQCGLFTFNWQLIYSLLGVVLTYFVILIQLEKNENSRVGANTTFWI